jgi:glycyl-tRNA synthetase
MVSIDELSTFAKKKGLIFPTAEIYGGLQGFYDYGPLGVELKNNVKQALWQHFVSCNDFVVGLDGSLITHPKVWVASEHVDKFADVLAKCEKCGASVRVDTLLGELTGQDMEGKSIEELQTLMAKLKPDCPKCKGAMGKPTQFKLMFETNIGPEKTDKSTGYLRPETAQLIFADFKTIVQTSRLKLPFGIAQVGKAFRNEISPRNFLFRLREFEQFEIEFFADPGKLNDCPDYKDIKAQEVNLASGDTIQQQKVDALLKAGVFASKWHAFWLVSFYNWFIKYGAERDKLRFKPHAKEALAHYAKACVDIEYKFPFGWKELHGNADRGQFDLSQHQKLSKASLELFDEASGKKLLPYVAAEPSQGIERAILVLLFAAYTDDKQRGNIVLRLHPKLAPIKVAVLPLVKKDGLAEKAKQVYEKLKPCFNCFYDEGGSIGRRYARQDEIGTPVCITIDYDSLKDNTVTIRHRDTTKQERVKLDQVSGRLWELLNI